MKYIVHILLLLSMGLTGSTPLFGGLLDEMSLFPSGKTASVVSAQKTSNESDAVSDIEKRISIFEKKLAAYAVEDVMTERDKVASELAKLKQRELRASQADRPFLQKKSAIVSSLFQVLDDLHKVQTKLVAVVTEQRDLLKQSLIVAQTQPKKEEEHRIKTAPTFDDVQKEGKKVVDLRDQIKKLKKEQSSIASDKNKRKRALDAIKKEYDEKKAQKESFSQTEEPSDEMQGLTKGQQGEILDEQLRLLKYRRELEQSKSDEGDRRTELIETKDTYAQNKLRDVDATYKRIKRTVKIDQKQVKEEEILLEKERAEAEKKRTRIAEDRRLREQLLEEKKREIAPIEKQAHAILGDTSVLSEWKFDTAKLKRPHDWAVVCKLGLLIAQQKTIEAELQYLDASSDGVKYALQQKELRVDILKTWRRLTRRELRLNVAEMLEQEQKKYESQESQLQAARAECNNDREKAIATFNDLNKMREEIKKQRSILKGLHNTPLNTEDPIERVALESLNEADRELNTRIDVTTKLMEIHASSLAIIEDMLKSIGEIIRAAKDTFWMRSGRSIEWNEFGNFWPNIQHFFSELQKSGAKFWENLGTKAFEKKITALFGDVYRIAKFFLQLLALLLGFLLLQRYLPRMRDYFLQEHSRHRLFGSIRFLIGIVFGFVLMHLKGIYLWSAFILASALFDIHSFFVILFYLFSIPYLLFLAFAFFKYFTHIDEAHGHYFVSEQSKKRFELVVPNFVYVSIVLVLFRHAFILSNDFSSQVPEILLALNFILFQFALIALISKDSLIGQSFVLGVVSRSSPFGKWLEERINRYYYAFLFALIIIILAINPWIGYGKQVLYVLSRLIISLLLLPLFSWVYESVKRASSDFFFYYPDGLVVKERFGGGKMWYGFFIIASFVLFVFIGIFIFGRIWDQGLALKDLPKIFKYPLYISGIDELTGQPIKVTLTSLLNIVFYLLGGFSIVYVINRFVLQRIFDPLLVGSGVQSTIMTLSRYAIVIIALLTGLNSAGLGSIVTKLWFIIGAIAYVIREPLGDFFSYFIILVQRPIKIGDYIELDDPPVQGVVRHITPRLTVIRHKNSVTFLVPNSTIITKTLRNWHYSRSFSAVDDITLVIAYSTDPERARLVMLQVLEEHPAILRNPAPIVWMTGMTENGYTFMVRGFVSSDRIMDKWDVESQLRLALVKKLQSEHIPLACPVRIISMSQPFGGDQKTEKKE